MKNLSRLIGVLLIEGFGLVLLLWLIASRAEPQAAPPPLSWHVLSVPAAGAPSSPPRLLEGGGRR